MVTYSLGTARGLKILVSARTTFFYIPALLGCCFQIVSTITRLNHRNLIVLGSWALFSLSFFRLRNGWNRDYCFSPSMHKFFSSVKAHLLYPLVSTLGASSHSS